MPGSTFPWKVRFSVSMDSSRKGVREAKVLSEPENLIGWFRELGLDLTHIGLEAGPLSQWLFAAMEKKVRGGIAGDASCA